MVIKALRTLIIFYVIFILLICLWFVWEFSIPPRTSPREAFFEIEKGMDVESIATSLKEEGVVKKKWPILFGYRLFYSPRSIKAGEYSFKLPLSSKKILETLIEGKIYLHPLTIPEGLTAAEIFDLLISQGFGDKEIFSQLFTRTDLISSLDNKAQNLEGYLFPETYHFPKGTSPQKIITTLVSQFISVFNPEFRKRAQEIGLTTRETVILASLIEKEASIPEERKLVSAVFHNRLKKGMKLDCDPTIIYILKLEGRYKDRLRTRDLEYDTPYNTYLYPGLPPGPICNPGLESIRAALYPASEDYLYFVSKNDGSHHFSRTLSEHLQAVNLYQKKKN
ncbi:MAG: endolytic transglycosylase MltG [Candidatus Aminicenantales bacterium]